MWLSRLLNYRVIRGLTIVQDSGPQIKRIKTFFGLPMVPETQSAATIRSLPERFYLRG